MLNDNHVILHPHKFLALCYHCMYCSQTPPNLQSGPAQLAEAWKQGYNEQHYLIRKFSPCVCLHVEGVQVLTELHILWSRGAEDITECHWYLISSLDPTH